jgi:xanthine dehydrogenase YagR molybdenum-binding subunit
MKTLKLDNPIGENRLDRSVQGLIGTPQPRIEGTAKVIGTATYSADHAADAIGYLITATVAGGSVAGIDIAAALAAPGVLAILPRQPGLPAALPTGPTIIPEPAAVAHAGQLLAMVVATSFEAARHAASLVTIRYAGERATRFDVADVAATAVLPPPFMFPPDHATGDTDAALDNADVRIAVTYTTPAQSHAAMEPHISRAVWFGDQLTVHTGYQMLARGRALLATALDIAPAQIRIISTFVGGGFGGKTGMSWDSVFAAQAARLLGISVRVAMTRRQVFGATSRRSDTVQYLELGATSDGRITAIRHDGIVANLPGDNFWEPTGMGTFDLYAAPNRHITHRLAQVDMVRSGMMRAPGEASGMLALESAIDELAEALAIDPVTLRIRNEPTRDPLHGRPFSSRHMVDCLEAGAARFGWSTRSPTPLQLRDGDWWIGTGVAAAIRVNIFDASEARVRLGVDGVLSVETDLTDIGTGSYTILAQIAGELLGLPMARIRVALGDTDLPASAGSGGSYGAASTGSAVLLACEDLIDHIAATLGAPAAELTFKDGQVITGNRSIPINAFAPLTGQGRVEPGASNQAVSQAAHGAHFAEVAVNAVTGEVRLRRMLGVFAAGRILNAQTARSQLVGGMIFGIGAALGEELVADPLSGRFVNGDLGDYLIPTHADVPDIDVVMLPEHDDHVNPLRAKGIGELGISGAGAAIANAVFNACGVRVRDFPIRLDRLLSGLPIA